MLLSFQRPPRLRGGDSAGHAPRSIAPERAMESSAPAPEDQSPWRPGASGSTAARKSSSRAAERKGSGVHLARGDVRAPVARCCGVPGPPNGRLGGAWSAVGRECRARRTAGWVGRWSALGRVRASGMGELRADARGSITCDRNRLGELGGALRKLSYAHDL